MFNNVSLLQAKSEVKTCIKGAFIFGGKNSDQLFDDIWHVEISPSTKVQDLLKLKVTKIEPIGKKPLPRYLHSSCIIGKYVAIYGGRNDILYNRNYSTIALNDI